jgi:hypothetical protein
MPLVKTNIPTLKIREVLEESRRVQRHQDQNFRMLNDSMALVTFDATHGAEVGIRNPFGDRGAPIGMEVISAVGSLGVASLAMRPARLTQDNRLGVTVQFQPSTVGRSVSSFLPFSSAPPMVSGTAIDITSVLLDPGEWEISAFSCLGFGTGVTGTNFSAGITTVSNSLTIAAGNAGDTAGHVPTMPTAAADAIITIPPRRFSVAAQTRYYLVAKALFSAGTPRPFGRLSATQVGVATGYTANVTAIMYGPNSNIITADD